MHASDIIKGIDCILQLPDYSQLQARHLLASFNLLNGAYLLFPRKNVVPGSKVAITLFLDNSNTPSSLISIR